MEMHILYGINVTSLDAARQILESTLNITMQLRYSDEMPGGEYDVCKFDTEKDSVLTSQQNGGTYDDDPPEFIYREPDFRQHRFIAYIDNAEQVPHVVAALDAAPEYFKKLRTETD